MIDKKLKRQLCKDPIIKKAVKEGKDIWSTIASVLFNIPYEDCVVFNDNTTPNPAGLNNRFVAKHLFASIYYHNIEEVRGLLTNATETIERIHEIKMKGKQKSVITKNIENIVKTNKLVDNHK
jgi:hypothetical protein